jgi:hypothetical protein
MPKPAYRQTPRFDVLFRTCNIGTIRTAPALARIDFMSDEEA